ncbi:MAG: pyrroloquinoline quinone biosynthesis protein PqqB [Nevskia sp.]|nr:pyrroloquinoline quinone biosynthesis protein PqqB [Nevskia sp.]
MQAVVLGAGAGGGFPQWNSNASGCRRARSGDPLARPCTQASLAVSAGGADWFILNASPDLRQQIEAAPFLHPREGLRSSPIAGVVLTGSDVDAIAGLLNLRERQAFTVYATGKVLGVLDANPVFEVLARDVVRRQRLMLDETIALNTADGRDSGLRLTAFAVPGKVPLYLEPPGSDPPIVIGEDTVGLRIGDGRVNLFFIPGCAHMTPELAARLRGAELVFFDGTLWDDREMIRAGLGSKTGRRMGHISVSGADGTIAAFAGLDVRRKVLLHINNSNPILLADSPEREQAQVAGWEVAFDGMEVTL